jgi:hypothetical protein
MENEIMKMERKNEKKWENKEKGKMSVNVKIT